MNNNEPRTKKEQLIEFIKNLTTEECEILIKKLKEMEQP